MTRNTAGLLFVVSMLAIGQSHEKRAVPVSHTDRDAFMKEARVAVVAAITDYPRSSNFASLRYPSTDADELEATLTAQGYNVVVVKDSDATKTSLLQAIHSAGEVLDQGQGTLVFYFSGHGFEVAGKNYLATYGANALMLSQTGLALDDVEREMRATGAARRIMWIDACRNTSSKTGTPARTFAAFQAAAGTRILFSTRAGRVSYENDDLRHGVFTYFLLQGLRGEAAGSDGLVTFRDLTDYVTASVRDYSLKRLEPQVPYDAGEAAGDFLLASTVKVPDPGPVPAATPAGRQAQGTILISTDSDVRITIDGEDSGTLGANQTRRVSVIPGSHIVVATSSEQSSVDQRKVVDVKRDEQEAVLIELAAAARAAGLRKEVEGTWTYNWEGDDRFSDGAHERYHAKSTFLVEVTGDGTGLRMVWKDSQVITKLDSQGGFTREHQATFHIQRTGDKLSGYAETARTRDSPNIQWQELNNISFSSTLLGGNQMAVEITWMRDSNGQVVQGTTPTLQKQQPPP